MGQNGHATKRTGTKRPDIIEDQGFTCAKYKLYIFKYFAKFGLIVHKTYLYMRPRWSSINTGENKAYYLKIKAGLLEIS